MCFVIFSLVCFLFAYSSIYESTYVLLIILHTSSHEILLEVIQTQHLLINLHMNMNQILYIQLHGISALPFIINSHNLKYDQCFYLRFNSTIGCGKSTLNLRFCTKHPQVHISEWGFPTRIFYFLSEQVSLQQLMSYLPQFDFKKRVSLIKSKTSKQQSSS